jgi:hypothetical protein
VRNFGLAWWGKPKKFSRVTPEAAGITGIRAHARRGTPEVGLVLVMLAAQAVTQLIKSMHHFLLLLEDQMGTIWVSR